MLRSMLGCGSVTAVKVQPISCCVLSFRAAYSAVARALCHAVLCCAAMCRAVSCGNKLCRAEPINANQCQPLVQCKILVLLYGAIFCCAVLRCAELC